MPFLHTVENFAFLLNIVLENDRSKTRGQQSSVLDIRKIAIWTKESFTFGKSLFYKKSKWMVIEDYETSPT